jgi:hypothetical protein
MTTRLELRTSVRRRFPRADRDDLIDEALDAGLKNAYQIHKFRRKTRVTAGLTVADLATYAALPSDMGELVAVSDITDTIALPIPLKPKTWLDRFYPNLDAESHGTIPCCCVAGDYLTFPKNSGLKSLLLDYYKEVSLDENSTVNPIPRLNTYLVRYALAEVFASIRDFESSTNWEKKAAQALSAAIYDEVTGRDEKQLEEFTVQESDPLTSQPWNSPFVRSWNSG